MLPRSFNKIKIQVKVRFILTTLSSSSHVRETADVARVPAHGDGMLVIFVIFKEQLKQQHQRQAKYNTDSLRV